MDPTEPHTGDGSAPCNASGDEDIGTLLRLVGQRPEISADRTARHLEVARSQWRRKVGVRTRRRRLWMGVAAAAVLLLLLLGLERFRSAQVPPVPRDTATAGAGLTPGSELKRLPGDGEAGSSPEGPVYPTQRSGSGDTPRPPALERGYLVQDSQWLETGTGDRAAIRLASGHDLRLDVDTRLRMVSDAVLDLERGAVYVDSQQASAGTGVEVRTALGVVSDVGTQFEVRLVPKQARRVDEMREDLDALVLTESGGAPEGASSISGSVQSARDCASRRQDPLVLGLVESTLRVRVRDGLVNVTRDGRTHSAGAGIELVLDAAGTVEHHSTPVYGPTWQWSMEIAPAFDIDGRTLRELLDWVARETGWRLRFNDPAVAIGTTTVTLAGSVQGLSPAEALATVLPTSGLRYRVVGGDLIVEPIIEPISTARGPEPGAT